MELTLEDKARIEQAAIVYTEGHGSTHKNWRGFIDGYKAATIYERQQQEDWKKRFDHAHQVTIDDSRSIVELVKKNNELNEQFANQLRLRTSALKDIYELEAERSEVLKENETLKAWKQSEMKLWRPIIEYMHLNGHLLGMKLGESITDKILEVLKLNSLKK